MKLIIVDLDGTLFDTKEVNYYAYKEAIAPYGYEIDYNYYCDFCNGRHYLDFLPQITTSDEKILKQIHHDKKAAYKKYLNKAILNQGLADILYTMHGKYKISLVTTASKQNTDDILNQFQLTEIFDLILTHDDIKKTKPEPDGFIKAMDYFGVKPEETIIFEDSEVGIEAAKRSGAFYYKTYGFN
jgi:beta-phosphoglucomutase